MYLKHFGLRAKPFQIAPSPRMLFPSESHDEGRARMLYGVRENRGFVVVTGGIGLGKTTVLMSVLEELEADVDAALIFNPVDEFSGLLRLICAEFDVTTDGTEVGSLVALNHWLIGRHAEGRHCVLLIDEAQNLPLPVLERLRLLSNLQTEDASLLQIVLVGQPELYDRLMDPRLVQLRQRIGVWHEIVPLGKVEVVDYIFHRLRLSGAPRPREIFAEESCHLVHALTGGIPRLINQLCDTALVMAYGAQAQSVSLSMLREAAAELRFGAAPRTTEAPAAVARAAPQPETIVEHPAQPRPRRRLSLASVATVLLLTALGLLVWRQWGRLVDLLPVSLWGEVGAPTAAAVSSPEQAVAAPASAPTETAAVTPEFSTALRDNSRQAELLRARQENVYSVHLASFESLPAARRYADDLLQRTPTWSQPLYAAAQPGSRWYRVLAGAFENKALARDWAVELRQSGVGYAQLAPLSRAAESLLDERLALLRENGNR